MRRHAALAVSLAAAALFLACVDIPDGGDDVLSFRVDPLPSASVIVGDTLRDSLGVAAPVTVTAFNYRGGVVGSPTVRFRALDARIRVDSISGIVVGDTASATSSRLLAVLDGFNGLVAIPVVLRPDTVAGAPARDTLAYSLTDTASNVSDALGVRFFHGPAAGDTAARAIRVTFDIISPADTAFVQMVNESRNRSPADTTDASGNASRRIRMNVSRLTAPVDSVVVRASVRHRGQHIKGSPVRLVLTLIPR
jgi:hypothetical protein